ncbi:MAG: DEAD/DEAH box helicase [Methanobacteriota archaeon]
MRRWPEETASSPEVSLPLSTSEDVSWLAEAATRGGDGAEAWRLNLAAHRLSLVVGFDRLLSWPSLRGVARYEHQERATLRVLRDMRGRAILADEVGMGKTIEAGLILKEYILRGLVRRVLVLPPPALGSQWREELGEKFGIRFEMLRSVDDWSGRPYLIASLDTAKRTPHRSAAQDVRWDLVIVDEAHRLKNRESQNWRFVAGLRKKYMLLLTATPVQNNLDELFNLVSLLKPGQLSTYDGFLERYVATADRRRAARVGELRGRLRDVIVRNRRGVELALPPRRVHSVAVRLSPPERRLYDDVTAFVRDAFASGSGRLPWFARMTLIVLQREIGSSSFAAARTLARMRGSDAFGPAERERLALLAEAALAVRGSVKADRLREFLGATDEKVLVFTQYIPTLDYLRSVIEADGISVASYHGGLSRGQKEDAVRAFRADRRVFLSTEAGGEGRNLQFARTLVNYDLPWNPLRIEQRIGRVHRLGQDREVHVVNVWARDTVEEYLIELLDRKIHLFEVVVGELDLILGNLDDARPFEEILMDIWTLREAEARRAALDRLGDALVAARARYRGATDLTEAVLDAPAGEAAT